MDTGGNVKSLTTLVDAWVFVLADSGSIHLASTIENHDRNVVVFY
jgi:hypothetical protein